jgi:hypothetical protein
VRQQLRDPRREREGGPTARVSSCIHAVPGPRRHELLFSKRRIQLELAQSILSFFSNKKYSFFSASSYARGPLRVCVLVRPLVTVR